MDADRLAIRDCDVYHEYSGGLFYQPMTSRFFAIPLLRNFPVNKFKKRSVNQIKVVFEINSPIE